MEKIDYKTKLNELLATYQLHYQNLRSLHWNIKGQNFFELHLKYEELYNRSQVIIDDIAERLLVLEEKPLFSYTQYLSHSKIEENAYITDGKEGMKYILNAQTVILSLENELLQLSNNVNDEGTSAMMSDLIREKEKTNWMFKSWLEN